jgi:outer membrane protein assembly factor BamB
MSDMCVLLYEGGVVLFAQPRMQKKRSWHSLPGTLYAYNAENGKLLWEHHYGGWSHNWQPDVFAIDGLVCDGLVWIHEHQDVAMEGHTIENKDHINYAVIGLDLMTGQIKQKFPTKEIFNVGHHHRCYRNKATERFLLASRRGVEFIDLTSGENHLHHWARGACLYGIVPCNGLLYLTPHPCDCYIATKLNGYFALAPQSRHRIPAKAKETDDGCFEQGPAYNEIKSQYSVSRTENPDDWPTFRHDCLRSGSTKSPVTTELDISWSMTVGGRISPPIIANGKLFVTSIDQHRVAAFDEVSGKAIWSFTADGRVDTPPTIYRDIVLFGSADGWVYCLRAADGRLAWRRRAAPLEQLVGAFGQLESAWPVHGSILVKEETSTNSGWAQAYLAAGRSSYLDGGIYLYSLNPMTGEVLKKQVLYSPDPQTGKMPPGDAKNIPGVLADILVSDGSSVYLRQEKVFAVGLEDKPHLLATAGFRDDSWFNRTRWTVGALSQAQLLVFDEQTAYGVQAYPGTARSNFFNPGGKGYLLFAGQWKTLPSGKPSAGSSRKSGRKKKLKPLWTMRVPVRVTAMVLAGQNLFIAGPPDVVPDDDPYAAFEGRKGAKLWVISAVDGTKLAEYELEHEPVFDGMAAGSGKLYIATTNGEVLCLCRDN